MDNISCVENGQCYLTSAVAKMQLQHLLVSLYKYILPSPQKSTEEKLPGKSSVGAVFFHCFVQIPLICCIFRV